MSFWHEDLVDGNAINTKHVHIFLMNKIIAIPHDLWNLCISCEKPASQDQKVLAVGDGKIQPTPNTLIYLCSISTISLFCDRQD